MVESTVAVQLIVEKITTSQSKDKLALVAGSSEHLSLKARPTNLGTIANMPKSVTDHLNYRVVFEEVDVQSSDGIVDSGVFYFIDTSILLEL